MAERVDVLTSKSVGSRTAQAWAHPCGNGAAKAGFRACVCEAYRPESEWLAVFGAPNPAFAPIVAVHRDSGRPYVCWDLGYFGKSSVVKETHVRCSLRGLHPTVDHIERTPADSSRFSRLGLRVRESGFYLSDGHVLVIGTGRKSREATGWKDGGGSWEALALRDAARRFPSRTIVYRPKPVGTHVEEADPVSWPTRSEGQSIVDALRGASLVICQTSNVALDACLAGVPVECTGGAAAWLYHRHPFPTKLQREQLLFKVCWWNWKLRELDQAWQFLAKMEAGVL